MKAHTTRLGLGKLKVIHSVSCLLGIGLPGVLVLGAWLTLNTLDEMKPVMGISFVLLLLGFFFEGYYSEVKCMDCPSCGHILRVRYDWECERCGISQGEERLIVEPCKHCGKKPGKISCMVCRKEMGL